VLRRLKPECMTGLLLLVVAQALDIGKMIALMHGQSISVFDLEDVDDWWTRG